MAGARAHAEVAGRHHNRQAHAARVFNRLHQRVCRSGLEDRMAKRKVQHIDAELHPISDREFDGAHDVFGHPLACTIEDLQADEARIGCHTNELAGNQPGDVRSVSEPVVWRHGPNITLRKVVERGDAVAEVDAGLDARIDHADADAGATAGD